MMTGTKFDIEKFDEKNDFALWQVRMKALLEQQGLAAGGVTCSHTWTLQKMTEQRVMVCEGFVCEERDLVREDYGAWVKIAWCQSHRSEDQVSGSGDDGECRIRGTRKVYVQMMDGSSWYVPELRRNLISLGTLKKEVFTVKIHSGKIKVIKGSLVVLLGTRRAICVYTLNGQAVTKKTLKGRKQLGEYQTGWKIKTGNVLDFFNQRSTQQCTKSVVAKHLGVAVIQEQNGLVKETNVTFLAKVRCFLIQSGLSKVLWAGGYNMSIISVNRSPSNQRWNLRHCDMLGFLVGLIFCKGCLKPRLRNMSFNESGEYKKTFISSSVGTSSVQVLQGVEFEVRGVCSSCKVAGNAMTTSMSITGSIHQAEIWATKGLLDKAKETYLVWRSSGIRVSMRLGLIPLMWKRMHVGMLDGFDRGLQTDVHVFVDFWLRHGKIDHSGYMTLTEAAKEAIGLKGLAIKSGFELKIVAGIATRALSKAIPGPRFQHRLTLLSI
ncbi:hypothetical protein Tco_0167642 [Tanacetum coccineum]